MSLKRDIAILEEVARRFERLLVRGTLPDVVVIRQSIDGGDDASRFKRDYECTPAQALERGVELVVERTNFSRPNIKLSALSPLRQDCDMAAEKDAATAPKS